MTASRRSFLKGITIGGGVVGVSAFASSGALAQAETFEFDGIVAGWQGLSPSAIEGTVNPTIELEAGKEYTVIWHNKDGKPHNFVIEDSEENNIVRTEVIYSGTQEVTFTATPSMDSYYCEIHPSSMRGDVSVSGELEQTTTTTTTTEDTTTTTTTEPSGEVHEVDMITDGDEYYFDPIGLHIEPGDTVKWIIESGSHSATAYEDRIPDGVPAFDSGLLTEEGAEFEQTFTTVGTVDYYCIPHKTLGMVGRVVVGEPGGPAEGSMPSDGDVPTSARITDEGSVSYESFQSGSATTTMTTDGGGEDTNTGVPGFGFTGALGAIGAGALLRRYRGKN